MLKNTFCHIPGISTTRERQLWSSGIHQWEDIGKAGRGHAAHKQHIEESFYYLEQRNPNYFTDQMSSAEHWRLFPEFRDSIAYLDIETTGLDHYSEITTIALYDGQEVHYYVNGQTLQEFEDDIERYSTIVTYNGKCFDVPFIERFFRTRIKHAHIDLRYVLKSLGYSGGLKRCEKQLGIRRGDLEDVDGFTAVLLWEEYKRGRNKKALETLLAYNIEDVLNLELLLIKAYNEKLAGTPFSRSHILGDPTGTPNPFKADRKILSKMKRSVW